MNLTSDKVFVDSNILIYSYSDLFHDKQTKARDLINSYDEVFISTQVMNEFVSAFVKKFKAEWPDIMKSLDEITENYIVYTNNPVTVKKACNIAQKYQLSFYDSLIISAAIECGCNILYSEDMQHGQIIESRLKIVNPFI
jgi:predicted nucleic acid-binding protein